MPTYAIGDIQGCADELQQLLALIDYDPTQDQLWFAGDLVNRGPKSLEVLRFISSLPNTIVVLGNHDWHLLTLALANHPPFETLDHSMADILNAPDRDALLHWLTQQKMLHYDASLNTMISHAGLPPSWSIRQSIACAREVEQVLQSNRLSDFLDVLYGDTPDRWNETLQGWDRKRYIVNALCRMRYVSPSGRLILEVKGKPQDQSADLQPWYEYPNPALDEATVLFGHWAALEGKTSHPNAVALDTGCVWGGQLSALRLEDQQWFRVPSLSSGT